MLLEGAPALRRELGDKQSIARSLNSLGVVAWQQGDYERATALLHEAMLLSRDMEAKNLMAEALEPLAWSVAAQGQPERVARLGGSAEALREALGVPLRAGVRADHDRALRTIRVALGEEAFAAACAEGRALPLEAAITCALK
jgi:non-specific serine/threonine protein kinase